MTDIIIDRRQNPRGKNLSNRQRFIQKVKTKIKEAIKNTVDGRSISNIESGTSVTISKSDVSEPSFAIDNTSGTSNTVLSGNDNFVEGDTIKKPKGKGNGSNPGDGNSGKDGDDLMPGTGQGEDDFTFVLSKDEYLDLFFEDLELPEMVRKNLKKSTSFEYSHSGYTNKGAPANLDITKSYKNSIARRLALKRPSDEEIKKLEDKINELLLLDTYDIKELEKLKLELETLMKRRKRVPFFDDVDLKYKYFDKKPKPSSNAVMFCIMDVSGSMDQIKKDWAKRFFTILYLFLTKQYKNVEIVFIRHHDIATECDEETFFNSTETGGTLVSPAIELMTDIIGKKYSPEDWNIYVAQASDGDNAPSDNPVVTKLVMDNLSTIQYYAYVQISSSRMQAINFVNTSNSYSNLWSVFSAISKENKKMQCKHIAEQKDIWKVFRELFEKG